MWREFRDVVGNDSIAAYLGRLVERAVERDRVRRIREGTVDDLVLLDALERARELHSDLAGSLPGWSGGWTRGAIEGWVVGPLARRRGNPTEPDQTVAEQLRLDAFRPSVSLAEPVLTAAAAAELLSVRTSWVYDAARSGELPCIRLGKHLRFLRSDLERWVAEQRA